MSIRILSIILAIVPSILLVWFFYRRDLNPEPRGTLLKTFFAGFGVVILLLILKLIPDYRILMEMDFRWSSLYRAFLKAAIPEELLKFGVLNLLCMRSKAFDEPMDGIVYGATASLGFATVENIIYVSLGGIGTAFVRAITAVPAHACFGAIMGYYAGRSRFGGPKRLLWFGLLFAIVIHGLYDYPLFLLEGGPFKGEITPLEHTIIFFGARILFVAVMVFQIIFVITRVRKLRRAQLSASN